MTAWPENLRIQPRCFIWYYLSIRRSESTDTPDRNQGERYMDALKKLGKQLGVVLLACVLNTGAIADTVTFFHNDISGNPLAATDATGTLLWKENYKRC